MNEASGGVATAAGCRRVDGNRRDYCGEAAA